MQQIPVLLITVALPLPRLRLLRRLGKRLARVSAHAWPDTVPLSYRKRISTNQREQSSLLIHTFVLTLVKLVVGFLGSTPAFYSWCQLFKGRITLSTGYEKISTYPYDL